MHKPYDKPNSCIFKIVMWREVSLTYCSLNFTNLDKMTSPGNCLLIFTIISIQILIAWWVLVYQWGVTPPDSLQYVHNVSTVLGYIYQSGCQTWTNSIVTVYKLIPLLMGLLNSWVYDVNCLLSYSERKLTLMLIVHVYVSMFSCVCLFVL